MEPSKPGAIPELITPVVTRSNVEFSSLPSVSRAASELQTIMFHPCHLVSLALIMGESALHTGLPQSRTTPNGAPTDVTTHSRVTSTAVLVLITQSVLITYSLHRCVTGLNGLTSERLFRLPHSNTRLSRRDLTAHDYIVDATMIQCYCHLARDLASLDQ